MLITGHYYLFVKKKSGNFVVVILDNNFTWGFGEFIKKWVQTAKSCSFSKRKRDMERKGYGG